VGGRRGSRLRLGADFGVPSTPEEPARAQRRERRKRRKEEGGRHELNLRLPSASRATPIQRAVFRLADP
jgi:hypothetical protein